MGRSLGLDISYIVYYVGQMKQTIFPETSCAY